MASQEKSGNEKLDKFATRKEQPMHPFPLVCLGVLGLLLFGLGLAVSLVRAKQNILIGFPQDPTHILYKVVRAHGNTAEYAPFLAIMFLYFASHPPATWLLWVMGAATVARVLIVIGILGCRTLDKVSPIRFLASLGTYVCGFILALALLNSVV